MLKNSFKAILKLIYNQSYYRIHPIVPERPEILFQGCPSDKQQKMVSECTQ